MIRWKANNCFALSAYFFLFPTLNTSCYERSIENVQRCHVAARRLWESMPPPCMNLCGFLHTILHLRRLQAWICAVFLKYFSSHVVGYVCPSRHVNIYFKLIFIFHLFFEAVEFSFSIMLCKKCEEFDIQALYSLAATRIRDSKPSRKGTSEYEGFPTFYKHYSGLAPLRASSEKGCRLCKSIWQQTIKTYGVDAEKTFPADQQIYFGLCDWDSKIQGIPFLQVIQRITQNYEGKILVADTTWHLAIFDVFAEQSEFFHVLLPPFIQLMTGHSIDTSRFREIVGKTSELKPCIRHMFCHCSNLAQGMSRTTSNMRCHLFQTKDSSHTSHKCWTDKFDAKSTALCHQRRERILDCI